MLVTTAPEGAGVRLRRLPSIGMLLLLGSDATASAQALSPAAPHVRPADSGSQLMILMELGVAYADSQRYAMALEQFQQALTLDPRYAPAHYGVGRVYAMQERFEEAKQELVRATQLAPGYADAFSLLSFVNEAIGDKPGAVASLEKAIALMKADEAQARLQADEQTLLKRLERRLEKLKRQGWATAP